METLTTLVLTSILLVEIVLCYIMTQMVAKIENTNRMAVSSLLDQNKLLTSHLQEVQIELMNLNHELNLLSIENKNLNREVSFLTTEVQRLQQQISPSKYDELSDESRSIQ